jgi:Domain of unknown function (DUF4263)
LEDVLPPFNRFRTGYIATSADGAGLSLARKPARRWTVHYAPSPEAIRIASQNDAAFSAPSSPILIIEGDAKSDSVVTYPLNTTATSPGFLRPKYNKLRTITFAGFLLSEIGDADDGGEILLGLPSGFVKDPYFGLGLNWDLRYLINAVEELPGVTDLRLEPGKAIDLPALKGASYVVSAKVFDDTRKAINRAHEKALTIAADEKDALCHNALLTSLDPKRFPIKHRRYRKDVIVEAIGATLNRDLNLSKKDREAIVVATKASARSISQSQPKALLELNREIEFLTLQKLVERVRAMLNTKLKEDEWQSFYVENPFILRLAFGIPIIMIAGQVSVGGGKLSGSGTKISDFAVKAALSGNLSLIEIKTPDTTLLDSRPYRGELCAPSRELSGAVNQLLDQRYQLQKSITVLKDTSGVWDIESYAIQGLVIVGRIPTDRMQLKSFELFRNGLKSILVITFDELVLKLEHLLELLRSPENPSISSNASRANQKLCLETDDESDLETDDLEAELD